MKSTVKKLIKEIKNSPGVKEAIDSIYKTLELIDSDKLLFESPPELENSVIIAFFKYHHDEIFNPYGFHEEKMKLNKNWGPYDFLHTIKTLIRLKKLGDNTGIKGLVFIFDQFYRSANEGCPYSLTIEVILGDLFHDIPFIKNNKETEKLKLLCNYVCDFPVLASENFNEFMQMLKSNKNWKENKSSIVKILLENILEKAINCPVNKKKLNSRYESNAKKFNAYLDIILYLPGEKIEFKNYKKGIDKLAKKTIDIFSKKGVFSAEIIRNLTEIGIELVQKNVFSVQDDLEIGNFLNESFSTYGHIGSFKTMHFIYQQFILNQESNTEFNL